MALCDGESWWVNLLKDTPDEQQQPQQRYGHRNSESWWLDMGDDNLPITCQPRSQWWMTRDKENVVATDIHHTSSTTSTPPEVMSSNPSAEVNPPTADVFNHSEPSFLDSSRMLQLYDNKVEAVIRSNIQATSGLKCVKKIKDISFVNPERRLKKKSCSHSS